MDGEVTAACLFAKTTPDGHGHDLGQRGRKKDDSPAEDRNALHMLSLDSTSGATVHHHGRAAHISPHSETKDLARHIGLSTLARTVMESARCSLLPSRSCLLHPYVQLAAVGLGNTFCTRCQGGGTPPLSPLTGARASAQGSVRDSASRGSPRLSKARYGSGQLHSSLLVAGLLRGGFGLGDLWTTNLPPSLHFTLQSITGTAPQTPKEACPLGAGIRSRATASATACGDKAGSPTSVMPCIVRVCKPGACTIKPMPNAGRQHVVPWQKLPPAF